MNMMLFLLSLTFVFLINAPFLAADYVRPPPRKVLDFPWSRKDSSHPQQVKN